MSSHPNVTKEEMINLAKLAEQQKTQRTIKTKNKILEQTHDKKLDESFIPITEKLGEVDKSTKKLKVFETSDSENKTPELAMKSTRNKTFSQPTIQNESHPGVLYDDSLECTLENMKKSEIFFKTIETPEGDITWNDIEDKKIGASRVEIRGNEYYISPELQKVFTNSSGAPIQNLNIEDEVISSNISRSLNYKNYPPQRRKESGRSNDIKRHLV